MKKISIVTAAVAAAAMLSGTAMYAQSAAPVQNCPTPVKHHGKKKAETAPCADFESQLAKQQAEIDALKAQLAGQQPAPAAASAETDPIATPLARQASADAADAANKAAAAAAAAQAATAGQDALRDGLTNLQKRVLDDESPSAIHYKDVTIQPSGFVAAESVYRTRALNSDIASPLNATPYPNGGNYHISEFNGSARQSRLAVNVSAPMSWGKASGYYEMDFLGAGVTSNNNQTNSYVLRVRTAFGTVTTNKGFTFQGGQLWTLMTEVKKGVIDGPGAEALPPTIDPNYLVGFNFGRQYGLRIAQAFAGGKVNAALSAEESQIVLATTVNAPGNFVVGGQGATGGLYNSVGSGGGAQNYTDNLAPDVHAKVTFDPGLGHYEIGGVLRFFRDRVYAQSAFSTGNGTDSTIGVNYMTPGGGVYASARVPVTKFADVALKGAYGKGIGRYGAANLGDVTVRPNGILEPLKAAQGLFELDLHPTKKLDIFGLVGAEYLQRTTYVAPTGVQVGYGVITGQGNSGCATQSAPGTGGNSPTTTGGCTGATRYELEPVVGLTYRIFNSPTKGRFQFQVTGSYLDRESWQGYTGASFAASTTSQFHGVQGTNFFMHTSFRYYIP